MIPDPECCAKLLIQTRAALKARGIACDHEYLLTATREDGQMLQIAVDSALRVAEIVDELRPPTCEFESGYPAREIEVDEVLAALRRAAPTLH